MKIRAMFVSNSSSTAFIIVNHTKEDLSILEFAKENIGLVDEYNDAFRTWEGAEPYGVKEFLADADASDLVLEPGANYVVFGDESGTVLGTVYDYMLRDGGDSQRFSWWFKEWLR